MADTCVYNYENFPQRSENLHLADRGDLEKLVERLNFDGIRVVAVSQGIDTQDEQSDVLMTVHSLVDSLYIKELAKKTHRGLEGRVLRGLHAGGRTYGYDNVPVPTVVGAGGAAAVQQLINDSQAVVVRRIFEMAADNGSLKKITKVLNSECVPPPRKRAGKKDSSWCPNAIREMLRNELYIGRVVWNRSRFVKQPGTNKRLRRPRPESEWIIIDKPELRIIDQELWDGVQKRIAWVNEKYNYGNHPGLLHRAATSPNLLTGFMKCGECGNNLTIVSGRGKSDYPRYGCPYNANRGVCSNGLKERADVLEARLFSALQDAVLQPQSIEYAVQEFERQLQSSLAGLDDRLARMRHRADDLQREIGNAVSKLIVCDHNPTLVEAINIRQKELDDITRQLLSAEPDSLSVEILRIREFVTEQLGDIRQFLTADVQKAKAELEKHVIGIRMVPHIEGGKGYYVAEGEWNLLGGYMGKSGTTGVENVRMVAGIGFEPMTFGL